MNVFVSMRFQFMKWGSCHCILTFMSFQICLTFSSFHGTQKKTFLRNDRSVQVIGLRGFGMTRGWVGNDRTVSLNYMMVQSIERKCHSICVCVSLCFTLSLPEHLYLTLHMGLPVILQQGLERAFQLGFLTF